MRPKKGKKRVMKPTVDLSINREEWKEWHILNLTGKFVVKSFNRVRAAFEEIELLKAPHVAVDLTDVTQIDSSALTIILNLQKRLKEKDGQVAVIGPNTEISETFSIVGFSLAVPVYSTRQVFERKICLK
jgi:anti-sigma B factor antagonist